MERSGGFAGRTIRRGLDTADLPAAQADALRELVGALPEEPSARPGTAARATGPDRFAYALEIHVGTRREVRHVAEPLPDAVRPLVQLLSRAPLLPAR